MTKPKVMIMNKFLSPASKLISPLVETINYWELEENQKLNDSFADVKGMVTSVWDNIDGNLIARFPSLEIISHLATGIDAIDMRAARARQIIVTNTPDLVTDDTADLAMGLLLALARKILIYDKYIRSGSWQHSPHSLSVSLKNKKIGIIGLGKIGMAIAKRAEAFNLKVYYWGREDKKHPHYQFVSKLVELAKIADFLVVTCAGNSETTKLINYEILHALGKNSFLINVSRGFVIDQQDLILALNDNLIAGAGLDVFENEPYVPHELCKMENVVLQPHVGSATNETRNEMYKLAADNILSYFNNGTTLSPVSLI